jgi:hypothetical protein
MSANSAVTASCARRWVPRRFPVRSGRWRLYRRPQVGSRASFVKAMRRSRHRICRAASFSLPHLEHRSENRAPHSPQNFRSDGLSVPHFEQRIDVPSLLGPLQNPMLFHGRDLQQFRGRIELFLGNCIGKTSIGGLGLVRIRGAFAHHRVMHTSDVYAQCYAHPSAAIFFGHRCALTRRLELHSTRVGARPRVCRDIPFRASRVVGMPPLPPWHFRSGVPQMPLDALSLFRT